MQKTRMLASLDTSDRKQFALAWLYYALSRGSRWIPRLFIKNRAIGGDPPLPRYTVFLSYYGLFARTWRIVGRYFCKCNVTLVHLAELKLRATRDGCHCLYDWVESYRFKRERSKLKESFAIWHVHIPFKAYNFIIHSINFILRNAGARRRPRLMHLRSISQLRNVARYLWATVVFSAPL